MWHTKTLIFTAITAAICNQVLHNALAVNLGRYLAIDRSITLVFNIVDLSAAIIGVRIPHFY